MILPKSLQLEMVGNHHVQPSIFNWLALALGFPDVVSFVWGERPIWGELPEGFFHPRNFHTKEDPL